MDRGGRQSCRSKVVAIPANDIQPDRSGGFRLPALGVSSFCAAGPSRGSSPLLSVPAATRPLNVIDNFISRRDSGIASIRGNQPHAPRVAEACAIPEGGAVIGFEDVPGGSCGGGVHRRFAGTGLRDRVRRSASPTLFTAAAGGGLGGSQQVGV